jgi:5-formyltetrahydrofolate cyclo-ligase
MNCYDKSSSASTKITLRAASKQSVKEPLSSDLLSSHGIYRNAKNILGYASLPYEVSIDSILVEALRDGKHVYLPKVISKSKMIFLEIKELDRDREVGKFGILEPKAGSIELSDVQLDEETLLLVPSLAVSSGGDL